MRDPNWTGPGPGPMIDVAEAVPAPTIPRKPATVSPPAPAAATGPSTTYGDPGFGFGVQERMASGVDPAADMVYAGGTPRSVFDEAAPYVEPAYVAPESEAERIARLDREAADSRAAGDLAFAQQQADLETKQRKQNARSTMAAVLSTYGLGDLTDFVYTEIIGKETVNINNPDAVIFAIREQPAYQKRFAGNAARLKAGLSELDPASYIGLENQFRQTLQSNGLPANFYDQSDDFQALIEGDVSPAELNERVQQGYRAVADADPAVKEQMRTLYGVGEGELAAYFLDPKRTAPLLTRQAQAASIAARGLEQGGIQLSGTYAEDLARRGITDQQARAGFAEVGGLGELRQTFAGETVLSNEQLAGAAFGIDVAAQQELERRKRLRVGEFGGGGSFARTTGETSGSISTSVGKAQ